MQARTESRSLTVPLLFFGTFYGIGFANGWYKEPAYHFSPVLYWILDVADFVVVPVLFVIALGRNGWQRSDFGLGARPRGADWFDFVIAAVFLFMILFATYEFFTSVGYSVFGNARPGFTYASTVAGHAFLRWLPILFGGVTAGVWEELVYKGLPTPLLQRWQGSPWKVFGLSLFSATAFSLIHWENGAAELFGTWWYGWVSFLLYTKIRALEPFMIAHAAIDIFDFSR